MLKSDKFYDKTRLLNRLKARTKIVDGHWLWIGKMHPNGRGVMVVGGVHGRDIEIHRVSAFIHHGLDLNDGSSHALHKPPCRIYNCWNPEHLYVGSHKDNMQDVKKMPTFKCGHPKNSENSKPVGGNHTCRICVNVRMKSMRKQQKNEQANRQSKTT